MSSSISRITTVHGSKFAERVARADEVAPPAPVAVPRLPDNTPALLVDLHRYTAADEAEWNDLLWQRDALNKRTLVFVRRMFEVRHKALETEHEEVKAAIRAQGITLENHKSKIIADTQEWMRLDNARRVAQARAQEAEDARKQLSRFSSRAEIDEADRAANVANEKARLAESKAADAGQLLNSLKIITTRNENLKLDELVGREIELAAILEGKDPFLARFGFQQ